jgi:parvulin-like peptidyl-prolyl isomerase
MSTNRIFAPKRVFTFHGFLLLLLLVAVIVNMIVTLRIAGFPQAERKARRYYELAVKLEERGLTKQAAEAWLNYLDTAALPESEMALILYKVGRFIQDSDYEHALSVFYQAQALTEDEVLKKQIAEQIQELIASEQANEGQNYAFDDKNQNGGTGGSVLAEIGSYKITEEELNRRIQELIQRQLAPFATLVPPEELQQRERDLKARYSKAEERLRLLDQIVVEEMLYRKALEDRLAEKPPVQAMLRDAERLILANQVVERALQEHVAITLDDLKAYYQAHSSEFVEPARARIGHILVADAKQAGQIRERLNQGESFAKMAEEFSLDADTKARGGKISAWYIDERPFDFIPDANGLGNVIFSTEPGEIADIDIRSTLGFHIIKVYFSEPARQRSLDETAQEINQALRAKREADMRKELLEQLKDRYHIVLHTSRLEPSRQSVKGADSNE